MIVFVEISNPFRLKPKLESVGALKRFIWLWFSIGYINAGFNAFSRVFRESEQEKIAAIMDEELKLWTGDHRGAVNTFAKDVKLSLTKNKV